MICEFCSVFKSILKLIFGLIRNKKMTSIFWCLLGAFFLCGSTAFSPRINGGQDIKIETVPYVASLRETHNNKPRHHCGAVIISPKYLLTAARCFYSKEPDWFSVTVGSDKKNDETVVNHGINRILVHEEYDEFIAPFKHDIALIELDQPLKLNDKVKTLAINTTFFEGHVTATAFGFGGFYVSIVWNLRDSLKCGFRM